MLALARAIRSLLPQQRIAVAVDGADGAGKTVLADELADLIRAERHVIRVSIDGFHQPTADRYRNGRGPESYYRDSYDYGAFRASVLGAFRRGDPVTPAVNDVLTDRRVDASSVPVGPSSLLLVDGIFLQRPQLQGGWDATVFVDVPFAVSVPRGNARLPGEHDSDPEAPPNRRYVEGQRMYLSEVRPRERATWVLDNTNLHRPRLWGIRPAPREGRSRVSRRDGSGGAAGTGRSHRSTGTGEVAGAGTRAIPVCRGPCMRARVTGRAATGRL